MKVFGKTEEKNKSPKEEIFSEISGLTAETERVELEILRLIIDEEIKLEDNEFKGSEEKLFYAAIAKIGILEVQRMMIEYIRLACKNSRKITELEKKLKKIKRGRNK